MPVGQHREPPALSEASSRHESLVIHTLRHQDALPVASTYRVALVNARHPPLICCYHFSEFAVYTAIRDTQWALMKTF